MYVKLDKRRGRRDNYYEDSLKPDARLYEENVVDQRIFHYRFYYL